MNNLSDNILNKLKCTECDCYLSHAPVFVKSDGRSVCDYCNILHKLTTRNISFESLALASQFTFPCKYKSDGCTQKQPFNEIKYHEEECEFRIYECFVEDCTWNGNRSILQQHYKESHSNLMVTNPSTMKPTITTSNENKYLLSAFGSLFVVHVKNIVSNSKLIYCVYFLGNSNYASFFEYVLEIITKQGDLKFKKIVQADNNLSLNDKCIELNVNSLLSIGIISQYNECNFLFTIKLVNNNCSICKLELTSVNFSNKGCLCDNCNSGSELIPVNVFKKCDLCGYESLSIDLPKHNKWFCNGHTTHYCYCYCCCKSVLLQSNLMSHYKSNHLWKIIQNNVVHINYTDIDLNCRRTILVYDTLFFFTFMFSQKENKFIYKLLADLSKSDMKYFICEVTEINPNTKYSVRQILKNDIDSVEYDWYGEIINTANSLIHVSYNKNLENAFSLELKISKVNI